MAEYDGKFQPLPVALGSEPQPRTVVAGQGWNWIVNAANLVKQQPGIWILMCLIYLLILALVSSVGFLSWTTHLLSPLLMAGLLVGCQEIDRGEELEIGHLFLGFRQNTSQLVGLGVLNLLATLLILAVVAIPAMLIGGMGLVGMLFSGGSPAGLAALGMGAVLLILITVALFIPLAMAMWFAPALVMLRRMAAFPAMRLSFKACLANIGPFLIYGLAALLLAVVAVIPFGLGLLLFVPVIIACSYTSFIDVFDGQITSDDSHQSG